MSALQVVEIGGKPYALASYEVDYANRQVHVRFAPVVEGVPDVHGAIEYETIRNMPDPPKPIELPPPPAAPDVDAPDEAHHAHANAMSAWLLERKRHQDATARYEAAMRQRKGWDEWCSSPLAEPDRAVDFFRKRRGL